MSEHAVDLSKYENPPDLNKGRNFAIRALWFLTNALILQNPFNPSSVLKITALRTFGAKIGRGCFLKPSINVKSPWFLSIGDHCFIGERVWIDSLAPVEIGNNVCLSQEVYICCGNHDWSHPAFAKSVKPIKIEDGVWIATRAIVMLGTTLRSHSVVCAGTVISKDTEPYMIYSGSPATPIKKRIISSD